MKRLVAIAFSIFLSCTGLRAEVELRIAVASNFHYTLTELAGDLEAKHPDVRLILVPGSSGKLYAQIAVGYIVNSERAEQFHKWATGVIKEFTIKGFAMDDERLKEDGSILDKKHSGEQFQRVREIRLSERKFYQKTSTSTPPAALQPAPWPATQAAGPIGKSKKAEHSTR